jgi:SagB-type dehydrogenase family enzyme
MKTLPPPLSRGRLSLEETLAQRRSVRSFTGAPVSDVELSQLLWAAQGITDSGRRLRAAPSAGGTYPLVTYAITPEAVVRYQPAKHAVEEVKNGDFRAPLADACLGQSFIRSAGVTIAFTFVPERITGRYGMRGIMYLHMEAGHAAENVELQAVALGLGSVPIGAFEEDKVERVIGCPQGETALYLVAVGQPRPR